MSNKFSNNNDDVKREFGPEWWWSSRSHDVRKCPLKRRPINNHFLPLHIDSNSYWLSKIFGRPKPF